MDDSTTLPITPDPADLRYEGEQLLDRVDFDGTRVVVTTDRVLVLTPNGPGRRLRSVYRPNVTGVTSGIQSDPATGWRAVQAGVYTALLLAGGSLVELDGVVNAVDLGGLGGLGGGAAVLEQILSLLGLLDDVLLLAGAVSGIAAVALAVIYFWQREREFQIQVAGGEPVVLPIGGGTTAADRLRRALQSREERSGDADRQ